MTAALLIAIVLVVGTILIHYEALRLISALVADWPRPPRLRILAVVGGCLAAHMFEIVLYAAAYGVIDTVGWGGLSGHLESTLEDYLYFSASAYSTLGMGDVYGTGVIRLMSAMEGVNGLFLIGWSTSFTYLAMERLWPLHGRTPQEHDEL